jgi:carbonic anhydrase
MPENPSASLIDELLRNNADYAEHRFPGWHALEPERHLAVVACMDSRMDIFGMLGLHSGDAHVIRNAGGVVTDDVIRSLLISQRLLNTRAIVLVHHTDCGLQKVTDDELKDALQTETGIRPAFAIESFRDPFLDVQQSMARLRLTPFLPHKDEIRGFVYDVDSGRLHEVHGPE